MFSQTHESDDEQPDGHVSTRPTDIFHLSIPLIHVTYQRLTSRLRLISQAIEAWPEAVEAIHRFKGEETGHELNSKNEFVSICDYYWNWRRSALANCFCLIVN